MCACACIMEEPHHGLSKSGGYGGYCGASRSEYCGDPETAISTGGCAGRWPVCKGIYGDRLSRSGGYTGYSWSETGGLLRSTSGYGGYGSGYSGLTCSGELRSYGAIGSQGQSIMLTKFDVKSFTHTLQPNDSLQGLAVKYGVTVERLKRINKLYTNDSIHVRKTLQIPQVAENNDNEPETKFTSSDFNLDSHSDTEDEHITPTPRNENRKPKTENESSNEENNTSEESDTEGDNSTNSNEQHVSTEPAIDTPVKCVDSLFSKIDGLIKDHKDSTRSQIEDRKDLHGGEVYGYQSYQLQ